MVNGEVWANVWYTDCIARVCPATGKVVGWVLMHGLRSGLAARGLPMNGRQMDVLNGAHTGGDGGSRSRPPGIST